MPPYIPWHLVLVRISGVCEILGGLGLLIPGTRRMAAWGLGALLIAVSPPTYIWRRTLWELTLPDCTVLDPAANA